MAQGNENHGFHTALVIIAGVMLAAAIWWFAGGVVTSVVRWIRVGEINILSITTGRFDTVRTVLPKMQISPHAEKLGPTYLDWPTLWNVSTAVGDYMRWPTVIVLVLCMIWILYHAPHAKFKNKYKLETLIQIQSRIWPVIAPIINFNPLKSGFRIPGGAVPANLPQFAESLAPDEWIAWARIPVNDGVPDDEAIRLAFTQQLGPRWEGLAGLRTYHRALLAAFVLKGAQQRKQSDDLLGEIARFWVAGKPEGKGLILTEDLVKRIDKTLSDKSLMEPVLEIAAKHAYRTTALLGILRWAREQGGVLAPAQFVWLRGEDRALWYALNNLGRRSYHAEAAGAMAHYMAEHVARRALPMPRVKTAIQPVKDYMEANGGAVPPLADDKPRQAASLKLSGA